MRYSRKSPSRVGLRFLFENLKRDCVEAGEQRWHRHQATLAWSLRTASPDRAVDLAKGVLKEYRRHLDDKNRRLEVDWRDWLDREWAEGMGRAVALTNEDPDLCAWAVGQCRGLPLKAWDAEEDLDCFQEAERIADTWFLIAFMAIEARQELDERIEPAVVRRLTQSYWAHGEFVDRYLWSRRRDGIGAEIAARYAVHFGEACDGWILRQAKLERLGASAVFGLLSQRARDAQDRASVSTDGNEEFVIEMVRIMGRRFDDEAPFELPQLELWGRVWLCLRAVDQAEETAREILWSRRQPVDRRYEILALRLLALVVGVSELDDDLRNEVVQLYKRVWPAHAGMPSEEKTDKQKNCNDLGSVWVVEPCGLELTSRSTRQSASSEGAAFRVQRRSPAPQQGDRQSEPTSAPDRYSPQEPRFTVRVLDPSGLSLASSVEA